MGFENGANRYALNSAPANLAHFFFFYLFIFFFCKNVGFVPRKAAKLENPVNFFLKCSLWYIAAKLENFGTKIFLQIYKILSNFEKIPKIAQIMQKFIVLFPGEEIEPWFWHAWISQCLKFFPISACFFFISSIFRGKQVVKVGTKVQNLGPSLFHENSPSFKFFQTMFSFAKVILLVRISAI